MDKDGAVIQLPREQFSEVQLFLWQAFGSPKQEPVETTDGGKLGWYSTKTIGTAIQFSYNSNRTQVIVLRPQPMSKVIEVLKQKVRKEMSSYP